MSLPWQIDLRFLGKLILKMKNRRIVAKAKRCKVAITWKFKTQQQFCYHINVIIIIFSICNEEFGVSTTPHGCSFNFNVVALELFDFAMWLNYRDRLFFIHSFFFSAHGFLLLGRVVANIIEYMVTKYKFKPC